MEKTKSLVFHTYTGTKTVKAAPMGANYARNYGAAITEETVQANIGNDGYLVEYPDGYRSWSPKKVFDEAYRIDETPLDSMKNELADLNTRMKEVTDALYNPQRAFSPDHWELGRQLDAMREYANRLIDRIACAINPQPVSTDENRKDSCIKGITDCNAEIGGGGVKAQPTTSTKA